MNAEPTAPVVIKQPSLGEDLEGVTAALTRAFAEARAAVEAGSPVVLLLDDRDLLGQGGVVDASVATAMLGLMRAFALEGAKPDWRVNAVSHRGDPEAEAVAEAVAFLGASGLSGQLLRIGTEHLGKVQP